jgi:dTDP-4-dehydrorhamnose 3,5-epimerase
MIVSPTALPEVLLLEPPLHRDERGWLSEIWRDATFARIIGVKVSFVQDNHVFSHRDVLRGLHYQVVLPQGRLVRVTSGTIFDVAVDLRRSSPTFGRWVGTELSAGNRHQLWIPPGFGHGFLALSETAECAYKLTEPWMAEHDRTIAWDDPTVGVRWPLQGRRPILSAKDASAPSLVDAEAYA